MHQKFRLWAIIMVLFSMLLSVGGIAFGRGLPDYALWHQKMGVQAEAILKPYQITNVVLTHPTEGQATAWFQAEKFQQAFPVLKQYAGQGSHRAQLEVGLCINMARVCLKTSSSQRFGIISLRIQHLIASSRCSGV